MTVIKKGFLLKIANRVIESADELSVHVKLAKCALRGKIYTIDRSHLNDDQRRLVKDCKDFISENLSSEMRHSDSDDASERCKDVTFFVTRLLASKISDRLKIALFANLNVVGYMFDRSRKNYLRCANQLRDFLDQIDQFKKNVSQSDLEIWNKSTYGGEEQIPYFRGYLMGFMSSN